MKTSILSSALALTIGLLAASSASANDGTITFNGMVTAQTCTINGNGTGAKNFTVTLPTVSAASLAAAGAVAGRTGFKIALSACSPATGNVGTWFEPGPGLDVALNNGALKPAAGGSAANVDLQLLNKDFSTIVIGTTPAMTTALAAGAATLQYYVQYLATGVAAAGPTVSTVDYTIVYN